MPVSTSGQLTLTKWWTAAGLRGLPDRVGALGLELLDVRLVAEPGGGGDSWASES